VRSSCDHLPRVASIRQHTSAGSDGIINAVKPEDAKRELTDLREKLKTLGAPESGEFVAWELRVKSALARSLGEQHHITEEFGKVYWTGPSLGDSASDARWFRRGLVNAGGILDAAIYEVEMLEDEVSVADESGIDAELWEHVAPEIRGEAWVKVARGALIFTEDRIRKWAGRPTHEVSQKLAVNIFGDGGNYRMGLTDSEKQGWQFIAQGIAQALRNVDTHRIQNRSDHKRYALGVVGACSLLLTQMRYEHGNRFQDTSPAASTDSDDSEGSSR
jgi:hypothetical protein